MSQDYPKYYEKLGSLMQKYGAEAPATMEAFGKLHHAGATDGAISAKVKELIALGIAVTVRCDGCISFHVHDALKAGATRAEIVDTIGVAILMGGGPSVVYGVQALEAVEQFEKAGLKKAA